MKKIVFSAFVFLLSNSVNAHSGGTNSYGCHTNHSNGDYHCHSPKNRLDKKSEGRKPSSIANMDIKKNKKFKVNKVKVSKNQRSGNRD